MPCTEHTIVTFVATLFVRELLCTSLLDDIKSYQSSHVVLPLKPSVSNISHACLVTTYCPTLQTWLLNAQLLNKAVNANLNNHHHPMHLQTFHQNLMVAPKAD